MVSFYPETGLIILVSGLDEVGVLLKMAVLRGHMVAIAENSAVSGAFHEREVLLVLFT